MWGTSANEIIIISRYATLYHPLNTLTLLTAFWVMFLFCIWDNSYITHTRHQSYQKKKKKKKIKSRFSLVFIWDNIYQGNLKGWIGSPFDPCPVLMLWGDGHIARHVWRRVIVPSDLVRSFGAIWAHYCYHVIHHAIAYIRDLNPEGKGNSR